MNLGDSVSIVMSKISEFLTLVPCFYHFPVIGVSSDKSEALGIFDRMCWLTFNPNWYSTLLLRMIQDHLKRSRKEIFPTVSRRPSRTFFAFAFLLGLYGSVVISVRFFSETGFGLEGMKMMEYDGGYT